MNCFIDIFNIIIGNICRSPIAEACFKSLVAERGVADQVSFGLLFYL